MKEIDPKKIKEVWEEVFEKGKPIEVDPIEELVAWDLGLIGETVTRRGLFVHVRKMRL